MLWENHPMSVSSLNTAMESAVAAMEAGDYADAITYANKALAYMAVIPDSRHGSGEMRWRTSGIEAFINQCRKMQSSANGIGSTTGVMQQQLVRYKNSDEELY
jgi:hypothetical protein